MVQLQHYEEAKQHAKEAIRFSASFPGAWRAMLSLKEMLNPLRFGWFSIKLWSHKVLRWWVPAFMLGAFVLNALLLQEGGIYVLGMAVQVAFYTVALLGYVNRGSEQAAWMRIPYYFCLVNVAAAVGIIEATFGKSYTTWTTARVGD